ncbi:hypothetical protein M8J75_001722 [Diaphorina citri]|nr:hypothetical protein M8J75_001722 [Diaphorina citri]
MSCGKLIVCFVVCYVNIKWSSTQRISTDDPRLIGKKFRECHEPLPPHGHLRRHPRVYDYYNDPPKQHPRRAYYQDYQQDYWDYYRHGQRRRNGPFEANRAEPHQAARFARKDVSPFERENIGLFRRDRVKNSPPIDGENVFVRRDKPPVDRENVFARRNNPTNDRESVFVRRHNPPVDRENIPQFGRPDRARYPGREVPPFARDNVPPFARENVPPFARDNVPPFARENVQPFERDNVPPFARNNVPPFARDNVPPFARENVQSFENNILPFARDNVPPFARDNVPPFARDNVPPFARDNVPPFARDHVQPFARDNVPPFARKTRAPFARTDDIPIAREKVQPFEREDRFAVDRERYDVQPFARQRASFTRIPQGYRDNIPQYGRDFPKTHHGYARGNQVDRRRQFMYYYDNVVPSRHAPMYNNDYDRNKRVKQRIYDDHPRYYSDEVDYFHPRQYDQQSFGQGNQHNFRHAANRNNIAEIEKAKNKLKQKNSEIEKQIIENYRKDMLAECEHEETRASIAETTGNRVENRKECHDKDQTYTTTNTPQPDDRNEGIQPEAKPNQPNLRKNYDQFDNQIRELDLYLNNRTELGKIKGLAESSQMKNQENGEKSSEMCYTQETKRASETAKWHWNNNEDTKDDAHDSNQRSEETTLNSYEEYMEKKFAQMPPGPDLRSNMFINMFNQKEVTEVIAEFTEQLSRDRLRDIFRQMSIRPKQTTENIEHKTKRTPIILTRPAYGIYRTRKRTKPLCELNNSQIQREHSAGDPSHTSVSKEIGNNNKEEPNKEEPNKEEPTQSPHTQKDTHSKEGRTLKLDEHPLSKEETTVDDEAEYEGEYLSDSQIMYNDKQKSDNSDKALDKILDRNLFGHEEKGRKFQDHPKSESSGSSEQNSSEESNQRKRKQESRPYYTTAERDEQRRNRHIRSVEEKSNTHERSIDYEMYENAKPLKLQKDYETLYTRKRKLEDSGERRYFEAFHKFAKNRSKRSLEHHKYGNIAKTLHTSNVSQDSSDSIGNSMKASVEFNYMKEILKNYKVPSTSKRARSTQARTTERTTITTINLLHMFYKAFSDVSPTTGSTDISSYLKSCEMQGNFPASNASCIDHSYYDVLLERIRDVKRGGDGKLRYGQTIRRSPRKKEDSCPIPDDYLKKHNETCIPYNRARRVTSTEPEKRYYNSEEVRNIMKKRRAMHRDQFKNRYRDPNVFYKESDELWSNVTKRAPIILTPGPYETRAQRITQSLVLEDVDPAFDTLVTRETRNKTTRRRNVEVNVTKRAPIILTPGPYNTRAHRITQPLVSEDADPAFDTTVTRGETTRSEITRRRNVEVFESGRNKYTFISNQLTPLTTHASERTSMWASTRRSFRRKRHVSTPRISFRTVQYTGTYYHRLMDGNGSNDTAESRGAAQSLSIDDSQIERLEAFVEKFDLKNYKGNTPDIRIVDTVNTPDPSKIIKSFSVNYDKLDNRTLEMSLLRSMAALRNTTYANDFKINLMYDDAFAPKTKREREEEARKLKEKERRERMKKKNTIKIMLKKVTSFKTNLDLVLQAANGSIPDPARIRRSVTYDPSAMLRHMAKHMKPSQHTHHQSPTKTSPTVPESNQCLFGSIELKSGSESRYEYQDMFHPGPSQHNKDLSGHDHSGHMDQRHFESQRNSQHGNQPSKPVETKHSSTHQQHTKLAQRTVKRDYDTNRVGCTVQNKFRTPLDLTTQKSRTSTLIISENQPHMVSDSILPHEFPILDTIGQKKSPILDPTTEKKSQTTETFSAVQDESPLLELRENKSHATKDISSDQHESQTPPNPTDHKSHTSEAPTSHQPHTTLVSQTQFSQLEEDSYQSLFGSIDTDIAKAKAGMPKDDVSRQISRADEREELRAIVRQLMGEMNFTRNPYLTTLSRKEYRAERRREKEYQRAMVMKRMFEMKHGKPTTREDILAEKRRFEDMVMRDASKDFRERPEDFTPFEIDEGVNTEDITLPFVSEIDDVEGDYLEDGEGDGT